jgi:hypothetical protein
MAPNRVSSDRVLESTFPLRIRTEWAPRQSASRCRAIISGTTVHRGNRAVRGHTVADASVTSSSSVLLSEPRVKGRVPRASHSLMIPMARAEAATSRPVGNLPRSLLREKGHRGQSAGRSGLNSGAATSGAVREADRLRIGALWWDGPVAASSRPDSEPMRWVRAGGRPSRRPLLPNPLRSSRGGSETPENHDR